MSILALQKRARRLGEIRLGDTEYKGGKHYPTSLDTFRLTSPAKGLLDHAARLWGGTVEPWQPNEKTAPRWQIVTEASEIPVLIPPQDPDNISWYELWSAGGLQRRCDGETLVSAGDGEPCICDPEDRECRTVTRVQFMLPDLPDIGVWLLSSTGYYAATELAMSIGLVAAQTAKSGWLPPATLAIDHRELKKPGEATRKFVVPVVRFSDPLSSFLDPTKPSVTGLAGSPLPALSAPATPLEAGPAADPGGGGSLLPLPDPGDTPMSRIGVILGVAPADGTVAEIQTRVHDLFVAMIQGGYWPDQALAAALMKRYGHDRLHDLKKPELIAFATSAWFAAKEAIE